MQDKNKDIWEEWMKEDGCKLHEPNQNICDACDKRQHIKDNFISKEELKEVLEGMKDFRSNLDSTENLIRGIKNGTLQDIKDKYNL